MNQFVIEEDYAMCLDCNQMGSYRYNKFCKKCGKPMTRGKALFSY